MLSASLALADDIPFDPNEGPQENTFKMAPQAEQPANPPVNKEVRPIPAHPKVPLPGELGALGTLSPFSDIAVIQKRFLPKTKRFEFYPNVGLVMNDAFFTNTILGARLGYYFAEKYGIEAMGLILGTTDKEVTRRLATPDPKGLGVTTRDLVTPQSYFGADFKWTPIYGKLGFIDKHIIPFDFYFLLGGGVTQTNQGSSPPTLHFGGGQIFAITKWMAFRWDLSWFMYKSDTSVANRPGGSYTNMHATLGMSFFFPEAQYR